VSSTEQMSASGSGCFTIEHLSQGFIAFALRNLATYSYNSHFAQLKEELAPVVMRLRTFRRSSKCPRTYIEWLRPLMRLVPGSSRRIIDMRFPPREYQSD
jgi:hypothetical protein